MGALDQLYQQVILDHYREKHGFGMREPGGDVRMAQSHQLNPLCGDEVTVRVTLGHAGADDVVQDVSWVGDGCSISLASTSTLHDLVVGETAAGAGALVGAFRAMIRARGAAEPDEELLGDAAAFVGVGRHANRVKCAMLGWTAFEDALNRAAVDGHPSSGHDAANNGEETA